MEGAGPVLLLIGGIFTLLGGLFLSIGGIRWYMTRNWVRVTGEVVMRVGLPTGPTYRWRDHEGREHQRFSFMRAGPGTEARVVGRLLSSQPRQPVPVIVRYDPNAPHRGVLDTPTHRGIVFAIIGIVALAPAFALLGSGVAVMLSGPS